MKIQGFELVINFYSLPILGLDVVFGVQYLEKFGKVVSNYKKITIEFRIGGW